MLVLIQIWGNIQIFSLPSCFSDLQIHDMQPCGSGYFDLQTETSKYSYYRASWMIWHPCGLTKVYYQIRMVFQNIKIKWRLVSCIVAYASASSRSLQRIRGCLFGFSNFRYSSLERGWRGGSVRRVVSSRAFIKKQAHVKWLRSDPTSASVLPPLALPKLKCALPFY